VLIRCKSCGTAFPDSGPVAIPCPECGSSYVVRAQWEHTKAIHDAHDAYTAAGGTCPVSSPNTIMGQAAGVVDAGGYGDPTMQVYQDDNGHTRVVLDLAACDTSHIAAALLARLRAVRDLRGKAEEAARAVEENGVSLEGLTCSACGAHPMDPPTAMIADTVVAGTQVRRLGLMLCHLPRLAKDLLGKAANRN